MCDPCNSISSQHATVHLQDSPMVSRTPLNLIQFLPLEQHISLLSRHLLLMGAIAANPRHLSLTSTITAGVNLQAGQRDP